eukprot:gnl/MRDRNA2_/MRDRNA2_69829_c0_seq1.p1 gnl/MRDRNA2_/MRDRNA2_69829_c0~~gnl/MRDRNA2_/MRDRNA2_69829_c0_seq1.p1  ORF type:complete len:416 (+),score=55.29 gnl/MRDRNA2_/MRDRNA2_69829_c0_seq1:75-1322(+)
MNALEFASRIATSFHCQDNLTWHGPVGTCLEYERLGICHDGKAIQAVPGEFGGATAHCCACGKRGMRENCNYLDLSPTSGSSESVVQTVAGLAGATAVLAGHAKMLNTTYREPEKHGWDPLHMERIAFGVRLLEQFLARWVVVAQRLTFLSLCARVCDAELPMVPYFEDAKDKLLAGDWNHGFPDVAEVVEVARKACLRELPVSSIINSLKGFSLSLESVLWQAEALFLSRYYNPFNPQGGFQVHEDLWNGYKRWRVVHVLLEDLGCKTQHCDMAEVGVFAGETSRYLLDEFPLLRLYGIDPYRASWDQPNANENVWELAKYVYAQDSDRATLYRNVSREVIDVIGQVDLVFIDGSHLYEAVKEDLSVWGPRAKRICGHDLNLFNGGVSRAVFEWAGERTIYMMSDSVWWVDVLS